MELKHEYLEKLIRDKLFKSFSEWDKEDFHFLLSLLNYPTHYSLGLTILTNLKNWVLYGSGTFFYSLEHIENILEKYHFNYDPYQECIKSNNKNIKMNIKKKDCEEESVKNETSTPDFKKLTQEESLHDFIKLNDNCEIRVGDYFSIDVFSFGFWVILFIVYLIFKSFHSKSPIELPKPKNLDFNLDFDFDFPLNKKELLNKAIQYFTGNKNVLFD